MSLLDAVTIMDQDDKHEQHTSPASNKRFSLRSDTKPAMNTESESTPERKKGTPKKKITDYFSTRNK